MAHAGSEKGIVTVSCGAATLVPGKLPPTSVDLVRRADAALYRAKVAGRDCVCCDPGEDFASEIQGSPAHSSKESRDPLLAQAD